MGYRFERKMKPEDFLRRFDVRNGAIMRMTFGCYYATEGHDRDLHNYHGWPNPDRVDDTCQVKHLQPWWWNPYVHSRDRSVKLEPIRLIEEGYYEAAVSYEEEDLAEHLHTTAWIDQDDDNLVHVSVHADFDTFIDEPKEAHFTLFVKSPNAIDAVCHGIAVILPGSPYPVTETEGE